MIIAAFCVFLSANPLITEQYGDRFTRSELPTGEWEQVESVHYFDTTIWLYSKADRKIACYDSTGVFQREIVLPSIGRSNYLGEDFVVLADTIFFLNCIDNRLERFTGDGKQLTAIPYDRNQFIREGSRAERLISTITRENSLILIGTRSVRSYFDLSTMRFSSVRHLQDSARNTTKTMFIQGVEYRLHDDSHTVTVEAVR